jgi:hypothetical protein
MYKEFSLALRAFDWGYEYSDDHRVYTRGRLGRDKLLRMHKELHCPFDLHQLQKWAGHMLFEDFVIESHDGLYYRRSCKYKNMAGLKRSDLMTQSEYDAVTNWFADNDAKSQQ